MDVYGMLDEPLGLLNIQANMDVYGVFSKPQWLLYI